MTVQVSPHDQSSPITINESAARHGTLEKHELRLNPATATAAAKARMHDLMGAFRSMDFSVELSERFPEKDKPLTIDEILSAVNDEKCVLLNVSTGTFTDVFRMHIRGKEVIAKIPGGKAGYDNQAGLLDGSAYSTFHIAGDLASQSLTAQPKGKFTFFPETYGVGSFVPNPKDPSDRQATLILCEKLEEKPLFVAVQSGTVSIEDAKKALALLLADIHTNHGRAFWDLCPDSIWIATQKDGQFLRNADGILVLKVIDQGSLFPEGLTPFKEMRSKQTAIDFFCGLLKGPAPN